MKLSIREINRSQAIYKLLCDLDNQIIQLDKKAIQIADKNEPVELCLNFASHKKEVEESNDFENDFMSMLNTYSFFSIPKDTKPKREQFEQTLSEVEALNIIGLLISIKKQERLSLINELIELGFEIKN